MPFALDQRTHDESHESGQQQGSRVTFRNCRAVTRWVVERTLAWLHRFRRLNIRYERRPMVHQAFLSLGCALICWNFLKPSAEF
jgi:transposase